MNILYLIAGILTLGMLIYLIIVLFKGEKL